MHHRTRYHAVAMTMASVTVAGLVSAVGLVAGAGTAAAAISPSTQFLTDVTGTVTGPGDSLNLAFGASGVTGTFTLTAMNNVEVFASGQLNPPNAITYLEPDPPPGSASVAQNMFNHGSYTGVVSLSSPLRQPMILHVVNLDASTVTVSGTSTTGAPITLTPLVKNDELEITGNVLNSGPDAPINSGCDVDGAGTNPNGGCGSIALTAASGQIQSFTLTNRSTGIGDDGWRWTLSSAAAAADLSVTKSDAQDPVNLGAPVVYTVRVTNRGPSAATGVTLVDDLPATVTFNSATVSGGSCSHAGGSVTCDLPDLGDGDAVNVTISVTGTRAGDIVNVATVNANEDDPNTSNNVARETTTIVSADLSITKSDSVDPANAGDPMTYTLTVTNHGPSPATDVTVTDTLPGTVTFHSATPSRGTCSQAAGVVTCDVASLAVAGSFTITLSVTPNVVMTIENVASVRARTHDPDPSNNQARESTVVVLADLSITKSDAFDPAAVGNPLAYTLTVTNHGPSPSTDVVVTDTLPATATFNSVATTAGTCSQASGVVTCKVATLAVGASFTVTISVTPNVVTEIVNHAAVTAYTKDPDPSDNTDSERTVVAPFEPGGAFVVGDLSATGSVLFWGSQWAKHNDMSGGPGPRGFKGFENSLALPTCGARWTTSAGNSSVPPATIPPLMAIIVSRNVTQSGSTISGTVDGIVVVRTDPGYGPNPGHEGTGTVVSVVC